MPEEPSIIIPEVCLPNLKSLNTLYRGAQAGKVQMGEIITEWDSSQSLLDQIGTINLLRIDSGLFMAFMQNGKKQRTDIYQSYENSELRKDYSPSQLFELTINTILPVMPSDQSVKTSDDLKAAILTEKPDWAAFGNDGWKVGHLNNIGVDYVVALWLASEDKMPVDIEAAMSILDEHGNQKFLPVDYYFASFFLTRLHTMKKFFMQNGSMSHPDPRTVPLPWQKDYEERISAINHKILKIVEGMELNH